MSVVRIPHMYLECEKATISDSPTHIIDTQEGSVDA